jgi:hypothetical protein
MPGLPFEGERTLAQPRGMLVCTGYVPASRHAPIEAGSVLYAVAMAEGPVGLVVTQDKGVRVVEDHGVLVLQ